MKRNLILAIAALSVAALTAAVNSSDKPFHGSRLGTPDVRSISAMSFGPGGILFIGDSRSAAVYAIETKDTKKVRATAPASLSDLDTKIAEALGTSASDVQITDMAVNPLSRKVYFAIQNTAGQPVILALEGDKFSQVPLTDVQYSAFMLKDAPAENATDNRGRSLRTSVISDMAFADGKLYLSGISNQEFSSTFRSIPYPFTNASQQSSLEIYHTAHGRYETNSPIRTFTTNNINGRNYLIASYTCTPLVLFDLASMRPGGHTTGRTVAEMGNGNSPVDMVALENRGESLLVLGNTNRPAAKMKIRDLASFNGKLTEKPIGTYAGVPFEVTKRKAVLQMDKLDEERVVFIGKTESGTLELHTVNARDL